MSTINQPFTHGLWIVKDGNQGAFIREWSTFARWTAKYHVGAGTGYLLQDQENATQFISFGPWKNIEEVRKWREDPEFKRFVGVLRGLCADFQPRSLAVVASSDGVAAT